MNAALALALLALVTPSKPIIDDFDKKIEGLLSKSNTVGCAIAYSENGRVRFAKGYGYANFEHKVKMKPESVHELASVSKQFTAACILQLADKGQLKLEDPITKFFEGTHADWSKVTVKHLLHHTGGLADYLETLHPYEPVSDQKLLDLIKDKPLKFEPGTKFEYSNSGYMLLGLIIAKASKVSIGDYLNTNIFAPAGMKTAVLNDTLLTVPNRADGYSSLNGKIRRESFTSSSLSRTGDGEIMASALDMIAWDAALRNGTILSHAMQKLMSEPSEPSKAAMKGRADGYGFGVGIGTPNGKLVQSHSGGWMGTNTMFNRYVDDKKCIVILCNYEGAPLRELMEACELRFLGKKIVAP